MFSPGGGLKSPLSGGDRDTGGGGSSSFFLIAIPGGIIPRRLFKIFNLSNCGQLTETAAELFLDLQWREDQEIKTPKTMLSGLRDAKNRPKYKSITSLGGRGIFVSLKITAPKGKIQIPCRIAFWFESRPTPGGKPRDHASRLKR